MSGPGQDEDRQPRRCCCPSYDAVECIRHRYPTWTWGREACSCPCHAEYETMEEDDGE